MPNRSDIRDWVRQHTLVESDDYADSKVDNVINQAIRDLSTQFNWAFLQTSSTITLVDGTAEYALPSDFSHLQVAIRSDCACPMQQIPPQDAVARWASDAESDKPDHFYLWGDNMVVTPTPGGASLPTITLLYYRQPTVLSNDTDEPEFHPQFHLLLAEFAAAKVWEREEDLSRSEYYMERYRRGVERMARYYLNRAEQYPLVIGAGSSRIPTIPQGRQPWLEV